MSAAVNNGMTCYGTLLEVHFQSSNTHAFRVKILFERPCSQFKRFFGGTRLEEVRFKVKENIELQRQDVKTSAARAARA